MSTPAAFVFNKAQGSLKSHAVFFVPGEGFYHVYGAETDDPKVQLNAPTHSNNGKRKTITKKSEAQRIVDIVKDNI